MCGGVGMERCVGMYVFFGVCVEVSVCKCVCVKLSVCECMCEGERL